MTSVLKGLSVFFVLALFVTVPTATHALMADHNGFSNRLLAIEATRTSAQVSTTPAGDMGTFTISYKVTALDADIYIPKSAAVTTGKTTVNLVEGTQVTVDGTPAFTGKSTVVLTSTADTTGSGSYYVVHEGDSEVFTVTAAIDPDITGMYGVQMYAFNYAISERKPDLRVVVREDADFGTDQITITSPTTAPKGVVQVSTNIASPASEPLLISEAEVYPRRTLFVFDAASTSTDTKVSSIAVTLKTSDNNVSDVVKNVYLMRGGSKILGTKVPGKGSASTVVFTDLKETIKKGTKEVYSIDVDLQKQGVGTLAYVDGTTLAVTTNGAESAWKVVDASSNVTIPVKSTATSGTFTLSKAIVTVDPLSVSSVVTTMVPVSNSFGTFTIKFDVTAFGTDVYIPRTTGENLATVGVSYLIYGGTPPFPGSQSKVLTSTAPVVSGYYKVADGDTETFTFTITLNPLKGNTFAVTLNKLNYATTAQAPTRSVALKTTDFRTENIYIPDTNSPTTTPAVARATYRAYVRGVLTTTVENLPEAESIATCAATAAASPTVAVRCTWGTKEIFNRAGASQPVTASTSAASALTGFDMFISGLKTLFTK